MTNADNVYSEFSADYSYFVAATQTIRWGYDATSKEYKDKMSKIVANRLWAMRAQLLHMDPAYYCTGFTFCGECAPVDPEPWLE